MRAAFIAFQEGHRDGRIDPLRYAALCQAAYKWPLQVKESVPVTHPVYGDLGPVYCYVQSAVEAWDKKVIPVYCSARGFIAVPAAVLFQLFTFERHDREAITNR